jgi:hypothetical protein
MLLVREHLVWCGGWFQRTSDTSLADDKEERSEDEFDKEGDR